jgi:hypothetical protein
VLLEREQLRRQHVLDRHHAKRHPVDLDVVAALHRLVVDLEPSRVEDHVDLHVALADLSKPFLGRRLLVHPRGLERGDGAVDVGRLDGKVQVGVPWWRPARPDGEAPGEQVRHVGIAQRRRRMHHRAEKLFCRC